MQKARRKSSCTLNALAEEAVRREDDDAEDEREAREEGLERVGRGRLDDVEQELEALADAAAGVTPTGKKAELLEAADGLGADVVVMRLEEPVGAEERRAQAVDAVDAAREKDRLARVLEAAEELEQLGRAARVLPRAEELRGERFIQEAEAAADARGQRDLGQARVEGRHVKLQNERIVLNARGRGRDEHARLERARLVGRREPLLEGQVVG